MIAKLELIIEASVGLAKQRIKGESDDVISEETERNELIGHVVKVLSYTELYFDE